MVFVLRETVHNHSGLGLKVRPLRFLGSQHRARDDDPVALFLRRAQVRDVLENGYWHARSPDYLGGALPRFEWLRLPGDLVFIFLARCRSSSPSGSAI
jgi:nitric oxide reductase subunit B